MSRAGGEGSPPAGHADPVDDELWETVALLLPPPYDGPRRPGRLRLPDRAVLNGVVHVLTTGIGWAKLPSEHGYGSGMTCWRRLEEWHEAGRWSPVKAAVVAHLERTGRRAEASALRRAEDEQRRGFRIGPAHRSLGRPAEPPAD